MEEIYPKMNKFVMGDKGGNVLPILPLGKDFQGKLGTSGR